MATQQTSTVAHDSFSSNTAWMSIKPNNIKLNVRSKSLCILKGKFWRIAAVIISGIHCYTSGQRKAKEERQFWSLEEEKASGKNFGLSSDVFLKWGCQATTSLLACETDKLSSLSGHHLIFSWSSCREVVTWPARNHSNFLRRFESEGKQ